MWNKLNMRKKAQEEQPLETPEEIEKLLKGKRFRIIDLDKFAMGDFGIEDEEEYNKLLKHNNEYALVTGIAVAGTDMEDTYVDVRFDDGYEIEALSTHHLTHLSFDEPDETDEKKLIEETMEASPYAELLRKYTADEIYDIAAGRKTDITEEEISQAKEVITRGIVANRLSMRKFSQSSPETIQKAQAGDENAIAQVIEENMGLISQALIKWGYTPKSDEFEDVMSDIKVEMLNRVIPQYDPSKGAFSTFLSTAVYNFLRRGTRKKEYKEKQKEVSLAEPVEEGITIEDTLADPTSEVVQMTLSSARENLQNWLHMNKPELEEIVLRVFDLKVEEYSHEQIAEALNQEGYTSKSKPFTRTMVNNYVNDWIKPALAQFFEAFKTAKLNMRKNSVNIDGEFEELGGKVYGTCFDKKAINYYNLLYNYVISNYPGMEQNIRLSKDGFCIEYKTLNFRIRGEIWLTQALGNDSWMEDTISLEKELSPEIVEVPYADFLNKYTEDEIFDIASGRKEATEEEVEQAKDVITRGIVANRLSMRKKIGVQVFPITVAKAKRLQTLINDIIQSWPISEDLSSKDIEYVKKELSSVFKTEELFNDFDNLVGDWKFSVLKIIIRHIRKSLEIIVEDSSSGVHRILQNIIVDVSKYLQSFDLLEDEEEEEKEEWKEEKSKKPLKERIREEMVIPSKEPVSKTLLVEELEKYTPELLNKYTADEIFDIAAGRKEATEEEVALAKEVITRGIVSNRLNMRKKAQKVTKQELIHLYKQEAKGIYDEEAIDSIIVGFIVSLNNKCKRITKKRGEGDPQCEEIFEMIENLERAKTPQEKMIAIDRELSVAHFEGFYVADLIEGGTEKFLDELHDIAEPKSVPNKLQIAGTSTSVKLLIEFAKDPDEKIRSAVAANLNTPPETLAELAKDEDEGVRFWVAANLNTPPETLAELAKDEDEGVRFSAVTNPNIPSEAIEKSQSLFGGLNMRKKGN